MLGIFRQPMQSSISRERENIMKNQIARLAVLSTKINRQHIQLVFAIIALVMLLLGIGAPLDGGGTNPH